MPCQSFVATFLNELDYLQEAGNAEQFAANFSGYSWVRVPRVFREHSTSRVLTLERLHGIKISDPDGLDDAGIDRKEVADRAATMLLDMVFEHGLFHADPHPGNFFIQPGGCRDGEAKVAGPGKFSEWKAGAFRSASADARGSSLDQVSEKPSRRGPPIIVALDARSGGDNAGSAI